MLELGQVFITDSEEAGTRLDVFLAKRLECVSRSRIHTWLEKGCFSHQGHAARKNELLLAGDSLEVIQIPEPVISHLIPEDIALKVIYEDEDIVVIDKPRGLVTHPGHGVPTGTLANALAYRYRDLPTVGGALRAGLVHRLDKDTTGLLVVARNEASHMSLSHQLQDRSLGRTYRALVFRCLNQDIGAYTWPLGRHARDPLRKAVREDGKPSETRFQVRTRFHFATELELNLLTGRTHQIRVHLSHAGYPVMGDVLYGGTKAALERVEPLYRGPAAAVLKLLPGQALHAWHLRLTHPRSGETMRFESELPADYSAALQALMPFQLESQEEYAPS
jgi:23S rRNA pseudouridine1911/1915/1917 synthase